MAGGDNIGTIGGNGGEASGNGRGVGSAPGGDASDGVMESLVMENRAQELNRTLGPSQTGLLFDFTLPHRHNPVWNRGVWR